MRNTLAGRWTAELQVLALAILTVLMLSGSSASSTLCIGQDGQFGIESGVDGRCRPAPSATNAAHSDTPTLADGSSCCGPCTDLRLGLISVRGGASAKAPSAPAG